MRFRPRRRRTGIKAAVNASDRDSATETPRAGQHESNQEPAAYTAAPMPLQPLRAQKIMDGTWVQRCRRPAELHGRVHSRRHYLEVTYHLNHEELATPFWCSRQPTTSATFRTWTTRS